MKKALSIVLVLTILLLSGANPAIALEVTGEDSVSRENFSSAAADTLFRLRAQLLLDPNSSQEEIDKIDAQLRSIGVEEISHTDVIRKLGASAQPMYNVTSTENTSWFSQRSITVINGRQYEAQIITGQWKTTGSPLYDFKSGAVSNFAGKKAGQIKALQALVDEIVSCGIGQIPEVGTYLSVGMTLYDIQKAYYEGLTPTTVIDNVSYSFDIYLGTTMKFVFVKYAGALDEGNQVLFYVGTGTEFKVWIDIPVVTVVNGTNHVTRRTLEYIDTVTSEGFHNDECKVIAAENYRLYKLGVTPNDTYYYLRRIPIVLLDTTITVNVPYQPPILN